MTPVFSSAVAGALLELHLNQHEWIMRRVDRGRYTHDERVALETTVEFRFPTADTEFGKRIVARVPRQVGATRPVATTFPIPLLFKRKGILTGLRVTDETGRPVPTLTSIEARPVMIDMLTTYARQLITDDYTKRGRPVAAMDHEILARLAQLVDRPEIAGPALKELERWARFVEGKGERSAQSRALMAEQPHSGVFQTFAQAFMVVGLLPVTPGMRRSISIDQEQHQPQMLLPVGWAASYTAELRLPQEVVFRDPVAIVAANLPEAKGQRDGQGGYWDVRQESDLVAIHATATRPDASLMFDLVASTRLAPGGIATRAWQITSGTALMFVGALVARGLGVTVDRGVVAAIIVALPAAYAIAILEKPSSKLELRLSTVPRRLLVGSALVTFIGASSLVATFPPNDWSFLWIHGWRSLVWTVVTISSAVLAAVAIRITAGVQPKPPSPLRRLRSQRLNLKRSLWQSRRHE